MNKIIVPTDFTKTADNAWNYAMALAKSLNSSLTLLYIDHHEKSTQDLQELGSTLQSNDQNIKMEFCIRSGNTEEVITDVAKEKNADLIIIGIAETGIFEETILGSNAIEFIRNSTVPLLIIPAKTKFKFPAKVVFATDYIELKNEQPLFALLNFVNFFNTRLFIVNVMKEDEKTSSKKVAAIISVKKLFSKVDHSFYYPYNNDVVSGINEFITETDSDIVALIPHKHNIFYRLFNLSQTKKLIFRSHVPILALPENMPLQEPQVVNHISYTVASITNINNQIDIF